MKNWVIYSQTDLSMYFHGQCRLWGLSFMLQGNSSNSGHASQIKSSSRDRLTRPLHRPAVGTPRREKNLRPEALSNRPRLRSLLLFLISSALQCKKPRAMHACMQNVTKQVGLVRCIYLSVAGPLMWGRREERGGRNCCWQALATFILHS